MSSKETNDKQFKQYVAETKRDYKYTLKFAIADMADDTIDCVEDCLKKYELKSASAFRKTPIQENPLDFPNITNMPVFIADIVMGYPSTVDFLRILLANSVGISPAQIAVYSGNDPRQIETDLFLKRTSPEYLANYQSILDPNHPDYKKDASVADKSDELYGAGYNVPFLKELEKVRKEREITEINNNLMPGEKIDHSTLPKDYDNFNKPLSKEDSVGLFGRVNAATNIKVGTL